MEEEFVVSYRLYYMERIVLFMLFLKVGLGRKVDSLYYIIKGKRNMIWDKYRKFCFDVNVFFGYKRIFGENVFVF